MKPLAFLKSGIAIISIIILAILCYLVIRVTIVKAKSRSWYTIPDLILALFILILICYLLKYTYPLNHKVEFSLYETITYDRQQLTVNNVFYPEWYGVYRSKIFNGGLDVTSRWNLSCFPVKKEYDYSQHSYFVSFGRQITSIEYNVWEQKGIPVIDLGMEPKWAIVQFSDTINPFNVYIYETERLFIDRKPINKISGIKIND